MKLDSCGSALFVSYLQHLCDTAVMADKKTGGQSVKKTKGVSFESNTKSNTSQLSRGLAQPREWLNLVQVGLRGAGYSGKASAQQRIVPISMIQSLGHLILPGCSAFLHPIPGNICKNLSIMVNAPVIPDLCPGDGTGLLWKVCHLSKQPPDHAVCLVFAIMGRSAQVSYRETSTRSQT